jgi:hypothetical protein
MTANATHKRICFVKSFKFHLRPQTYYDKTAYPAFPGSIARGSAAAGLPLPEVGVAIRTYTIPNCRANK